MKLISVIVALAILMQPISAAAYNSCHNDRYQNLGDRTCITHCQCGSLPETCGCCSTNCTMHETGSSPQTPQPSGNSNSSGSAALSGPAILLYLILLGGCIYLLYQSSKETAKDSSATPQIRTMRGLGFAF